MIIIFGVSGAGKTTVGKRLARELGWQFFEADDFHPAANIEKLRSGHPLTDEDRWPWLDCLQKQIAQSLSNGENAVLACSALKRAYRDRLRVSDEVKFVFSSRRLCAGRKATAQPARPFHGCGLITESVR